MKKRILLIGLAALFTVQAFAQIATENNGDSLSRRIFTLGEVSVSAARSASASNAVSASQLQAFGRNEVSKGLDLLPGVTLSAVGPRNEAMVYVRGFDLRQVPLLIDGIPVYVPYDGYVDLARFTTFDLSEIQVSKGYTSVNYGPNSMGGAINLITRRPVKPFELDGATGWRTGGYRSNINVGSNQGRFYMQAGASKFHREYYPLSEDFRPARTEDGGRRDNSYNSDEKYSLKIAFTPNRQSEYALSYIYQHGTKGTPVYTGTDTLNSLFKSPRYWQWPKWDKQSLYFLSNTVIDSTQYIKTRIYYDRFVNLLESFDDATYSTITRPYAFKSYYNDYTLGGIVEYGKDFSSSDNIVASLQYKQDVHREHNEGEPVRTMSDRTLTAAIENQLNITPRLLLLTGLGFNNRSSIKAQDYNSSTKTISNYPSNDNSALNVQGALQYSLDANNVLDLSVARKTRFATTKDRYSYRMGTALPNPHLAAEYAVNYDLSYKSHLLNDRLDIEASLFYSRINHTILTVSHVAYDTATGTWLSELQNVGRSEYLGAELGAGYQLSAYLKAGANYTYIRRNNLDDPGIYFTDVPRHKLLAYAQYSLKHIFSVQANAEYNSRRYSTSYGTVAGAFTVFNAGATVHIWKWFSAEAGVNNIADENYALTEGYPEPGRNYFANLIYRL